MLGNTTRINSGDGTLTLSNSVLTAMQRFLLNSLGEIAHCIKPIKKL